MIFIPCSWPYTWQQQCSCTYTYSDRVPGWSSNPHFQSLFDYMSIIQRLHLSIIPSLKFWLTFIEILTRKQPYLGRLHSSSICRCILLRKGTKVLDEPAVFSTLTTEAARLFTRPCSVAIRSKQSAVRIWNLMIIPREKKRCFCLQMYIIPCHRRPFCVNIYLIDYNTLIASFKM
jgi:hypothetical protein